MIYEDIFPKKWYKSSYFLRSNESIFKQPQGLTIQFARG